MNSIMKPIWIFLLLGSSAAALAQTPTGEESTAGVDAGDAATPCVTAGENLPQDGENLPQDGEQGDGAPDAVPCEEQAPQADPAEAADDTFADAEENELEITGDDVTAQEEVETGEEIPEDYPVPLPADI
jgi:hypothetical protein